MDNKVKIPRELLVELETHLQQEKSEVLRNIEELKNQDPFSDTDRLMDNAASDTEAKEEWNHDRYQAMLKELTRKLEDIDAALNRIEKGTYGYCLICGQLIDTDRLAAMPTATHCMQHNSSNQ